MAHVKMLAARLMIAAAIVGAGVAASLTAYQAASAAVYVGSYAVGG